ncbi:MAG TPA: hypothetical protein VF476_06830 [Chitinophagaceae bacterium]
MKTKIIIVIFTVLVSAISCKKDTLNQTTIKGNVYDSIRGVNISGYKVVLIKSVGLAYGGLLGMEGTIFEKVAEAYTDNDGNYTMKFNYKLEPGQSYYFKEQYYGIPYYHESTSGTGALISGATNIVNMTVWKPVELKLNLQVINNNIPPLVLGSELAATNRSLYGVEMIYQQNITGTYILRSKPGSDINIVFWYTVNYASPNPVTHQKIIPYHTTLDSSTTLNYVIDCSTF